MEMMIADYTVGVLPRKRIALQHQEMHLSAAEPASSTRSEDSCDASNDRSQNKVFSEDSQARLRQSALRAVQFLLRTYDVRKGCWRYHSLLTAETPDETPLSCSDHRLLV